MSTISTLSLEIFYFILLFFLCVWWACMCVLVFRCVSSCVHNCMCMYTHGSQRLMPLSSSIILCLCTEERSLTWTQNSRSASKLASLLRGSPSPPECHDLLAFTQLLDIWVQILTRTASALCTGPLPSSMFSCFFWWRTWSPGVMHLIRIAHIINTEPQTSGYLGPTVLTKRLRGHQVHSAKLL